MAQLVMGRSPLVWVCIALGLVFFSLALFERLPINLIPFSQSSHGNGFITRDVEGNFPLWSPTNSGQRLLRFLKQEKLQKSIF
jgi:hypothetical protein